MGNIYYKTKLITQVILRSNITFVTSMFYKARAKGAYIVAVMMDEYRPYFKLTNDIP